MSAKHVLVSIRKNTALRRFDRRCFRTVAILTGNVERFDSQMLFDPFEQGNRMNEMHWNG